MAPKTRQRISYVLPLDQDSRGHRLGVNSFAVDEARAILYSAGRDGVIGVWDASPAVSPDAPKSPPKSSPRQRVSRYRQHTQAHFHWVNDISLVQSDSALVSASSDSSVKVWRPYAQDKLPPQAIGHHTDFVKRVASPGKHADWIASGALDQQVSVWDLNGGGSRLQIDTASENCREKGGIYALAATETLIATGGAEHIVKLWDPRSGRSVTNFVGHTDMVRDLLISQDNRRILSASSDRTVKVWSLEVGRCINTLIMHDDSVWTLKSNHPQLATFYSGDRSGLLAKTDTRHVDDMDEGTSIAVCKENQGIVDIATIGDSVWTATWSSSINCWEDVDMSAGVQIPEAMRGYRWPHHAHSRSRASVQLSISSTEEMQATKLPLSCLLQTSNRIPIPSARAMSTYSAVNARKPGGLSNTVDAGPSPLRKLPVDTIEGQDGLRRHVLLNDKRRVLTLDTTGNVVMWDLLLCSIVKSFGKKIDLQELADQINEPSTTNRWATVDTTVGTLTVTLDEARGFDAEIYADETGYAKDIDFKEDQRINLGKWILRYLFSALLEEEIRRDEHFRRSLTSESLFSRARKKPRFSIEIPLPSFEPPYIDAATPRGRGLPLMTPGLAIGVATPAPALLSPTLSSTASQFTPTDGSRVSAEGGRSDYFSQRSPTSAPSQAFNGTDTSTDKSLQSPTDAKSPTAKDATSRFGKKLLSNLNKSGKMFSLRSKTEEAKAPTAEDKAEDSDARSSQGEVHYENNFRGFIQERRAAYTEMATKLKEGDELASFITPSLPTETPVLKPPPGTTIVIQEDTETSGGVVDLFEGRIEHLGLLADVIEGIAPTWLADALLRNRVPAKEHSKVAFIVEPWKHQLPRICNPDGSERLNANRMLRARKVCAYVADKLEPPEGEQPAGAMRPEEYIELVCNDQVLSPNMTLAWVKAQIWKKSDDIVVYYRANGKREIRPRGDQLWYANPAT